MTYLGEQLPFGSTANRAIPPAGSHLLLSDTTTAPGYFALYHLISAAILDKRKIVWVDFRGEGRAGLESALKKIGTSLPTHSSKLFVSISPSSLPSSTSGVPPLFDDNSRPTLRPTWDTISPDLDGQPALVILDGLSELVWMGFEPRMVVQFVRAALGLSRKNGSSLISTVHADHLPVLASSGSTYRSGPDAELLDRLIRISNCWWRVSGLSSGRSGNVSGEISSHSLVPLAANTDGKAFPVVPRSNPLQYRLESNTVKVFAKGTGRGYL